MQVRTIICLLVALTQYTLLAGKSVVLFSPDDKPTKHLIRHINNAKNKIYVAIYAFTDINIAKALIDAKKKRKVDVQIVTDKFSVESNLGKAKFLKKNRIKTFVFNKPSGIMHNKFAIIDNKVWTGSFNWTISANRFNQENVIWTNAKTVLEKFSKQFEILKKRCAKLKLASSRPQKQLEPPRQKLRSRG